MADLALGTILGGRYRLTRLLGRGGMGAVYEATHEHLNRRVAVKVLLPDLAAESEALTRFQREAQITAQLGHPNIVQVLDFDPGSNGSPPYLVMERLEGQSLQQIMKTDGALPTRRVTTLARQVLAALSAAHAIGVVHRDVKPDNVFVTQVAGVGEVAKVLDFGIAKLTDSATHKRLTATGVLVGTPAYMAPEQLSGGMLDARADLYAVGVMLYRAIADRAPFVAKGPDELIRAKLQGLAVPLEQVRPDVEPALAAVVMRAMAADPRARFENAAAMDEAIARAIASPSLRPPVVASTPPPSQQANEPDTRIVHAGGSPSNRPPSVGPKAASMRSASPAGRVATPPSNDVARRVAIYVGVLIASVLVGGGIVVTAIRSKRQRIAHAGPRPQPPPSISPIVATPVAVPVPLATNPIVVVDAGIANVTTTIDSHDAGRATNAASHHGHEDPSTTPRFDLSTQHGCHAWHFNAVTNDATSRWTGRVRICTTGEDITGESEWHSETAHLHYRLEGSWIADGHSIEMRETALTSSAGSAPPAVPCLSTYAVVFDGIRSLRGVWSSPACNERGTITLHRDDSQLILRSVPIE